jgi:hypothetical protein
MIVRANPTQNQTAQDERDRFDQHVNRWATVGLGFLTLVVLVIQGYLLSYQNDIMDQQTDLIRGQLRATKRAANAAKLSAETASLTLKLTQRAFVMVRSFNSITNEVDGRRVGFGIRAVFSNAGQIPARDLRMAVASYRLQLPMLSHPTPPIDDGIDDPDAMNLPKGGEVFGRTVSIPNAEIEQILAGTLAVFFHTSAVYRDGFPDTPLRRTIACHQVVLNADPRYARDEEIKDCFSMRAGPSEHNYAD